MWWFALETKRDHSVVFETASKYCISDSFVDHDGYSISSFFYFLNFKIFNSYMRSQTWTPSHLPPHNISLGHPHAPAPSMLHPASDIEWHWNVYYHVRIESPVYVRRRIQHAWGWCTGMTQRDVMGREVGGGSCLGTHVHPWWIHVNVWQNQYSIVK